MPCRKGDDFYNFFLTVYKLLATFMLTDWSAMNNSNERRIVSPKIRKTEPDY